jgi:hypothetical protein
MVMFRLSGKNIQEERPEKKVHGIILNKNSFFTSFPIMGQKWGNYIKK